MRTEDETGSFALEKLPNGFDLIGRRFLLSNHVIEAENHEGVGVGENALVDGQSLTSLINNPAAPELNALASDYGLATNYTGVGDPSEPNYVGMLAGSTFGLSDDNPYFWPGHTQNAANLLSQLDSAGKTWKGYLGGLPYPGYQGSDLR